VEPLSYAQIAAGGVNETVIDQGRSELPDASRVRERHVEALWNGSGATHP
jgi:hypothetical protein